MSFEKEDPQLDKLQSILDELDEDDVQYEDEEAEVDYKAEVKKRKPVEQEREDSILHSIVEKHQLEDEDDDEEVLKALVEQAQESSEDTTSRPKTQVALKSLVLEENLKKLSADLNDTFTQSLVGVARIIRISPSAPHIIAVGTTYGLILLYSRIDCRRLAVLGTIQEERKTGAVTCLDFGPPESSLLAAGYNTGHVVFWNIDTCMPAKMLTYDFRNAVSSIGLLSNYNSQALNPTYNFVAADTTGSVKYYSLKKFNNSFMVEDMIVDLMSIPELAADSKRIEQLINGEKEEVLEEESTQILGEVKPLPRSEGNNILNKLGLVAVAYKNRVLILSFAAGLSLVATLKDITDITSKETPVFAWKKGEIPNGEYASSSVIPTSNSPVLAVSWKNGIFLYPVAIDADRQELVIEPYGPRIMPQMQTDIKYLAWIYENVLLVGGPSGNIHVVHADYEAGDFDPRVHVVEKIQVPLQEGYPFAFDVQYNGGLNAVREGAPVHVMHPSSQLITMSKIVRGYSIKGWMQRLQDLKHMSTLHALQFIVPVYNNSGTVVIGLPADGGQRRKVIAKEIATLLDEHIDDEFKIRIKTTTNLKQKQLVYEEIGRTCIDYALQIHNYTIFWGLYNKFKGEAENVFLTLLPKFILQGKTNTGASSLRTLFNGKQDSLFFAFIKYNIDNNNYDELEECLLNIELVRPQIIGSEDGAEYAKYLKEHFNTLQAILKPKIDEHCVFLKVNAVLHDILLRDNSTFVRVLDRYLGLYDTILAQPEKLTKLTKGIMQYLASYLSGAGLSSIYPLRDDAPIAKRRIIEYILSQKYKPEEGVKLHKPPLEYLVSMDSASLFKILESCIFDISPTSPWPHLEAQTIWTRQRVLETFCDMMISFKQESKQNAIGGRKIILRDVYLDKSNLNYPIEDMYNFFTFLVSCVAYGPVQEPAINLSTTMETFFHAINFLTNDKTASPDLRNKRQSAILELLKRYDADPATQVQQRERIAEKAELAHFFRLGIYIYTTLGRYKDVIRCYLGDDALKGDVYSYIEDIYGSHDTRAISIKEAIFENIVYLIQIDPTRFAKLIIKHFKEEHTSVIAELQKEEVKQKYQNTDKHLYEYLKHLVVESVDSQFEIDEETLFIYVKLLCKYSPHTVTEFLEIHQTSKLDEILKFCDDLLKDPRKDLIDETNKEEEEIQKKLTKHVEHIQNIICFLYERKGEVATALIKIQEKMRLKRNDLVQKLVAYAGAMASKASLESLATTVLLPSEDEEDTAESLRAQLPQINGTNVEGIQEVKTLFGELDFAIRVCATNTKRKTVDKPKKLWFSLFSTFQQPLRKLRYEAQGKEIPKDMVIDNPYKYEYQSNLDAIARIKSEIETLEEEVREFGTLTKEQLEEQTERKQNLIRMHQENVDRLKEQMQAFSEKNACADMEPLPLLANLWLQRVYLIAINKIIAAMTNYIALPVILSKVITENKSDELGQYKSSVMSMLGEYEHDRSLLAIASDIIEDDNFELATNYKQSLSEGILSTNTNCPLCGDLAIAREAITVRIFDCGHVFHARCIGRAQHSCVICTDKHSSKRLKTKKEDEKEGEPVQSFVDMKTKKLLLVEQLLEEKSKMHLQKSLEMSALQRKVKVGDSNYAHFVSHMSLAPKKNLHNPNSDKQRASGNEVFKNNTFLDAKVIDFNTLDRVAELYS